AKTEIFGEDPAAKKAVLAVMDVVLSAVLRLLHPLMPHITEELWSVLALDPVSADNSIQFAQIPAEVSCALAPEESNESRRRVAEVYGVVQTGRNLRAESRLPSNQKAKFVLRTSASWALAEMPTIRRLLNAEDVSIIPVYQSPPGVPVAVTPLGELHLLVAVENLDTERERLDREIARLETEVKTVATKLANTSFTERAPAAVVEEHRRRQLSFTEQLAQLKAARAALD
ncbi:MAG: class I tRNA ligase family protein, partial [Chthoniobacterales bacterium]|nr:class I tRNA ligase family protein [Chthoniobacterales bacterium]